MSHPIASHGLLSKAYPELPEYLNASTLACIRLPTPELREQALELAAELAMRKFEEYGFDTAKEIAGKVREALKA